jgi:hypothetical protein
MNKYAKKAEKENFLSGTADTTLPTKQRLGKAAAQTGIMLLAGLGGGFVGAGTGRWSLLTGLLVAGTGQFTGTPAVTAFGLGMATSNVFSPDAQTVSGTDDKEKKKPMVMAKERMKTYAQGLKQKLFLDKILAPKKKEETKSTTETTTTTTETTDTGTAGMGEVTYMKYPLNAENMDMTEMERYEKELEKSAQKYMQENETFAPVSGTDIAMMEEERLY